MQNWQRADKWTANERRAEIIRILIGGTGEKMSNLAFRFGVSIRTICYDIEILTATYPIETMRGNGGCVKLSDDYHPYKNLFSEEQQETLAEIIPLLNSHQADVIKGLLKAYGSKRGAAM